MRVIILALFLTTGCSGVADIVKALAKDPATACVNITSISGTMRLARTNITNGNVSCVQEGLTVQSDAQKIGVPVMVVPQVTIGAPVKP